jgi:hypothetical protein
LHKNSSQRKHFSLLGDIKVEPAAKSMNKPISISEAARSLNVSKSAVWNFIKKGKLDKVIIDNITFVSQKSIDYFTRFRSNLKIDSVLLSDRKVIVDIRYLEEILLLLGQLKTENQYLMEYQEDQEKKKSEMLKINARIVELDIKESEAQSKIVILEKENKYMRTVLWILVGVGLGLVVEMASLLIKGA